MSIEQESKLWKELADIIIKNANRETEEWLEKNGMLEEYRERVRECECSRIDGKTEKVL